MCHPSLEDRVHYHDGGHYLRDGSAILHPFIIKMLKLKDPVAIGVAFGTASHAIGTSKALEMGEVEGAVSGVAMGVAGICTVIIALFL